jgi:hypothetical protein
MKKFLCIVSLLVAASFAAGIPVVGSDDMAKRGRKPKVTPAIEVQDQVQELARHKKLHEAFGAATEELQARFKKHEPVTDVARGHKKHEMV